MKCSNCGSENVSIQVQQVAGKVKKSGNGIAGHTNNFARGMTAVCTFGISNIFWKKAKGSEKMAFSNQKICLCQNCGHSWTL